VRTTVLAVSLVVLVAVASAYSFVLIKPNPYPIPEVNVSVTLPPSIAYEQLGTGSWDDFWPAWSPNGSLIAYVSDRSGEFALWMMSANGSNAVQASPAREVIAYPSWNSNSTMVAYWSMNGQESEINIFDVTSNSTMVVPGSGPFAVQSAPAWSPDGTRLAFFERSFISQLVVFDLDTGVSSAVANASGTAPAAWLSNDSLLYSTIVGGSSYIYEVDLATGEESSFVGDGLWNYTTPAVASDGSVAYYSDWMPDDYPSYLPYGNGYDVWFNRSGCANATWQFALVPDTYRSSQLVPIPFIPGIVDNDEPVAWNSNATDIAYSATSAIFGYHLYIWNVVNLTTVLVGPPLGTQGDSFEPTWSPDGLHIAFCCNIGGYYHIWVTSATGGAAVTASGY